MNVINDLMVILCIILVSGMKINAKNINYVKIATCIIIV